MSLRQKERVIKLKKALEEPPADKLPQDIESFAASMGIIPDSWQKNLCEIVADKEKPARVFVLASRQSGKSYCTALAAIFHALTVPNSTTLLLSPTLRQSSLLFRRVIQFYKAAGRPVKPISESALQLRLENGAWVQALPANETNLRGISSVSLLVMDEFSRVPESLYFAVLPMLATMPNSKLVALTTPAGKRGAAFLKTIPKEKRDKKVLRRLTNDPDELMVAIAWLVQGYFERKDHGLQIPDSVTQGKEEYEVQVNPLYPFVKNEVIFDDGSKNGGIYHETRTLTGELLQRVWDTEGKVVGNPRQFNRHFKALLPYFEKKTGIKAEHKHARDGSAWINVRLRGEGDEVLLKKGGQSVQDTCDDVTEKVMIQRFSNTTHLLCGSSDKRYLSLG